MFTPQDALKDYFLFLPLFFPHTVHFQVWVASQVLPDCPGFSVYIHSTSGTEKSISLVRAGTGSEPCAPSLGTATPPGSHRGLKQGTQEISLVFFTLHLLPLPLSASTAHAAAPCCSRDVDPFRMICSFLNKVEKPPGAEGGQTCCIMQALPSAQVGAAAAGEQWKRAAGREAMRREFGKWLN